MHKRKKRGRPPRPTRTVIQVRCRQGGKSWSFYSVTLATPACEVMKALQELFSDDRKYQRLTDDTRWVV